METLVNREIQQGLRAVVLGSTGAVGRTLIRELCASPNWTDVQVIVRRRLEEWNTIPGASKLKIIEVDSLDNLENTQHWNGFNGYDTFFCTLGSRTNKGDKEFYKVDYSYTYWGAQIAQFNKIPHYSLLSSGGANPTSMFLYLKTKGQVEEAAKKLNFPFMSIFRPGFIRHRENDSRFIETVVEKLFVWCTPSIESSDCGKAMRIDAENKILNQQQEKVLVFDNKQMNKLAADKNKKK